MKGYKAKKDKENQKGKEKGRRMIVLACVSGIISALVLEGDKVIPIQEKYNMATFMVLFLLITIEVVVVKVITSDMERDEDSHSGIRAAATFFDREE